MTLPRITECRHCARETANQDKLCEFCKDIRHEFAGRAMAVLVGRIEWKVIASEEFDEVLESTLKRMANISYRQADIMLTASRQRPTK